MRCETATARVLVAEDVPMSQTIIERFLTGAGHSVTVVPNGLEAVEAIREGCFDLILMDIEMPQMDGISATRAIRGMGERGRDIPIIALTANVMLEDAAACKAAGMNDHLPKPIDRQRLLSIVKKWFEREAGDRADAPSGRSAPQVIDEQAVLQLEETLGREQTAEFSRIFRQQLTELTTKLAPGGSDVPSARDAHNLFALAGNFGCVELMNLARSLSVALRSGTRDLTPIRRDIAAAADRVALALSQRYAE